MRGITLMELMVTVIIITILTAVAVPNFSKTIELSHWRTARDLLLTIYSGERLYFDLNNAYIDADGGAGPPKWADIYMENPNMAGNPVVYSTENIGAGPPTFRARAIYNASKDMTIDQNRNLCMTDPAGVDPCDLTTTDWPQP